jgi:hypothetical protein
MRNYLLIFMAIIFISSLSSAVIYNLEPTRLGQCRQIIQQDAQTSTENLTFILRPDGKVEKLGVFMLANGNGYFNYTYCNTNLSGTYTANGVGNYSGSDWNYEFKVNLQGKAYETVDGIIYIVVFSFLIIIGTFLIIVFVNIPINNASNNEGQVLSINWNKYIKIFVGCMLYVLFIGLNYFAWNISLGILEFQELGNFFRFMFRTSYGLMYPLFIGVIIWSVAQYIKDKKVEEFIKRNLTFK